MSSRLVAALILVLGSPVVVVAQEPPTCFGEPATIVATGEEETVRGTTGDDVIVGSDERDVIYGEGGNDKICAGPGWEIFHDEEEGFTDKIGDYVEAGWGDDMVDMGPAEDDPEIFERANGGAGSDFMTDADGRSDLDGSEGHDTLEGGDHDDYHLEGGSGDDSIDGGNGDDVLTGDVGKDRLTGGEGDDHITPMQGADTIDGGDGRDLLDLFSVSCGDGCWSSHPRSLFVDLTKGTASGMGDDTIAGIEDVWGGGGSDRIVGNEADNLLAAQDPEGLGGEEINVLKGGDGNDTLLSGQSRDRMYGGPGSDTITFSGNESGARIDLPAGYAETDEARDAIRSVENAIGTYGSDTFIGDGADNYFEGHENNDAARGGAGDDHLHGGAGRNNRNSGGPGTDTCVKPGPGEPGATGCEAGG